MVRRINSVEKVIVTAAITGATTVPSQTEYLPITPEEIAQEAVRACEAGAAVVHIHARNPQDGSPSSDLQVFGDILRKIKSRSDVIVCTTTGGGVGMTIEERISVVPAFKPEMASFSTGSMNFGLFPAADKIDQFKFAWEKNLLENTRDFVFKNTFVDMEYFCRTMYENGTKPELEIYDAGHLSTVRYMLDLGILRPPLHIQFVMGVLGGIGNRWEDLIYLKQTADRLLGDSITWSVIGVGYPAEFYLGTMATIMGGHVRVGLEDNIRVARGKLARSNAELVTKMVKIINELGKEVATPEEARAILGLKGLDEVCFPKNPVAKRG